MPKEAEAKTFGVINPQNFEKKEKFDALKNNQRLIVKINCDSIAYILSLFFETDIFLLNMRYYQPII